MHDLKIQNARICDGLGNPISLGTLAVTGKACAVPANRSLKMFWARVCNGEVQILASKR